MKIFGIRRGILKTVITILGIKFSIKHPCLKIVSQNYAANLSKLQNVLGKRKIKVGFLVNEQAKWQYQSLYEEMGKSDFFEPVVLVTELSFPRKKYYKTIEDCYKFFKDRGLNVRYVYDKTKKEYTPAKDFDVDILFYQQPWMLDNSQHPFYASKFVLTCYVPYGLCLVKYVGSYTEEFHYLLWMIFVDHKETLEEIKTLTGKNEVNATCIRYAKLDAYFKIKPHKNKQKTIIYAPHHSFEKDGIQCATFHKNGREILALAQKYQKQINWIFKPHPRFKTAVIINNIMSENEVNDYYCQWEKLGSVYDSGDYFQLFADSDALITDCCSFLGEYLPSGNPIFHLISPTAKLNDFAKSFIDSFYQIYDISDLEETLKEVIFENHDTKKKERLSKVPLIFDKTEPAATKIINFLTSSLRLKQ